MKVNHFKKITKSLGHFAQCYKHISGGKSRFAQKIYINFFCQFAQVTMPINGNLFSLLFYLFSARKSPEKCRLKYEPWITALSLIHSSRRLLQGDGKILFLTQHTAPVAGHSRFAASLN